MASSSITYTVEANYNNTPRVAGPPCALVLTATGRTTA
jgi:hypothetical protein